MGFHFVDFCLVVQLCLSNEYDTSTMRLADGFLLFVIF